MASRKKTLSANAAAVAVFQPQHEEIALRAYQFFVQRGCAHGRDLEDWLQAEREVLAKSSKKPAGRRKSQPVEVPVS